MTKINPHSETTYDWLGKTILIAEDEEINYRYLEIILSKTRANILHAENGVEVVEKCKNNNIDMVLMDIRMPLMDGLEATRKIREFKKKVPIIALTAYAMESNKELSLEAGCDVYISKPVRKMDLLGMLNKFLT